jgi:hypothetical protein
VLREATRKKIVDALEAGGIRFVLANGEAGVFKRAL